MADEQYVGQRHEELEMEREYGHIIFSLKDLKLRLNRRWRHPYIKKEEGSGSNT